MAFSAENPPLWFKLLVYVALVVLALGLIFLAERSGLEKWISTLDEKQTEIYELFDLRLDSITELSDNLKNEPNSELSHQGSLLQSLIPTIDLELLGVDELSELYLSWDDALNSCVIELSKYYGKEIPSHLLIPVRTLMENESSLDDSIALYHEQVSNYDRAAASVLNILATSVMDLPKFYPFTINSALRTPY